MNEEMQLAWLEISDMLGEPTREELDVFLRTWQRASQATRKALAEQPAQPAQPAQQEPVAHSAIAGALFDFMGWLTSRKERLVLSGADEASPAVDAIRDFAKMRGLSLDDAKVQDWHTAPQAQRKPLTDEEIWKLAANCLDSVAGRMQFARAIEAAHGIKENT